MPPKRHVPPPPTTIQSSEGLSAPKPGTMSTCRHCKIEYKIHLSNSGCGGRGLCGVCYSRPGMKEMYESFRGRRSNRRFCDICKKHMTRKRPKQRWCKACYLALENKPSRHNRPAKVKVNDVLNPREWADEPTEAELDAIIAEQLPTMPEEGTDRNGNYERRPIETRTGVFRALGSCSKRRNGKYF